MKTSRLIISLSTIVAVIFLFIARFTHARRFEENLSSLNETVETGIFIQQTADDFDKETGRYPTHNELLRILPYLCSFKESITPFTTNTIKPIFDNSGGWFYNEKSGEVKINYDEQYIVGFKSRVEISKIVFHNPTKVEVVGVGSPDVLDYSYLDIRIDALRSQISEVVTNWAATNRVATDHKLKNHP